jgi:lipopolysaccharide/colanic/teichoic acid biosynthesis glycosyltransferase
MAKRLFDIAFALLALILAIPLFLIATLGVYLSMGRPILFRQTRIGLHGREFRLAKFRSMRDGCDAHGALLPDEARVTPFGRWLRRLRMDELPELVQIVGGAMAVVGPRPLPPSVVGASALARRRHAVRPGLTGLAQVSGNTLLSQEEKVAIDILYNDTRTFAGDMVIIGRTIGVVFAGERRNEPLIGRALAHAQHIDRRG